jgi:hypothetical protein
MVAPAYAATRRELAKKIGLGRKPGQKSVKATPIAELAPATAAAGGPVVAPSVKAASKPKAATKVKAAATPQVTRKRAVAVKPAADAKPVRLKKLGVQFGESEAVRDAQS